MSMLLLFFYLVSLYFACNVFLLLVQSIVCGGLFFLVDLVHEFIEVESCVIPSLELANNDVFYFSFKVAADFLVCALGLRHHRVWILLLLFVFILSFLEPLS